MTMKKTFVTLEKIREIARDYPTPFHLYDEKGIRENVERLKEAFSWNKGFREFFAVKANPNPFLIDILREYGCGCDCSSMNELKLAEAMGACGEDIMFSSNDTPREEYAFAAKLGAIINLDDAGHIPFLEKTIGESFPDTMCLRYNPGGEFRIGNAIMGNPGESKFGMTKDQIFEAVPLLMERGVKRLGIHAFLASNTTGNEYYPTLAGLLFRLAAEIHERFAIEIGFVNLSGGVGIPYRPEDAPVDIGKVGKAVKAVYDNIPGKKAIGDVGIYTELGRYMMGPYGCLVTKVIHEKKTYRNYLGCDACASDLMRPAVYGAYHHITVAGKESLPSAKVYDVTGSLCENNDKFAVERELPRIQEGDYLIIHDTGAHGYSMGYNYNGRLRHAEILLKTDGSFQLIRRAETAEDYFATLDRFPIYEKLIR